MKPFKFMMQAQFVSGFIRWRVLNRTRFAALAVAERREPSGFGRRNVAKRYRTACAVPLQVAETNAIGRSRLACIIFLAIFCMGNAQTVFGQITDTDKSSSAENVAGQQDSKNNVAPIPDPKHAGGEPDGIVQVANLVYATTKSSECFAEHFLVQAEKDSSISTSRRFHAVKLASDEIYEFPLLIMTGEGSFSLPDQERENLRTFIQRGGFLLASSGCSSKDWDRSFRKEMASIFQDQKMAELKMEHAVFHTVYDIEKLKSKHGRAKPLEGISFEGRLGVLYSQDGLNDTAHTTGCCCCGGNELTNSARINVNILAYALTH